MSRKNSKKHSLDAPTVSKKFYYPGFIIKSGDLVSILRDMTAFQVGSLAMMGLGTWMLIDPHRFDTLFADDDIKPMAAIILCLGFSLFFNGFFGCCGALQKRNSCLLIYVTVMLLITLGELIIVILSRLRVDEINLGSITTEITNGTIEDDYIQPTAITYIVDYVQEEEIVGASLEQRNMAIFMGVLVGVLPFEICAMIFSSLMIYANKRRNECC